MRSARACSASARSAETASSAPGRLRVWSISRAVPARFRWSGARSLPSSSPSGSGPPRPCSSGPVTPMRSCSPHGACGSRLPPLSAIVVWRSRRSQSAPFRPRGVPRWRWIAMLAGAGGFFVSGAATTFAALGLTRLLDVTLIGSLQPILIIAFAVAFLGEHVARTHLVRAVVAIAGTATVAAAASGSGSWSLAGDVVAVREPGPQLGLVPLWARPAHELRRRPVRVHAGHALRGRVAPHAGRAGRPRRTRAQLAVGCSSRGARPFRGRPRTC